MTLALMCSYFYSQRMLYSLLKLQDIIKTVTILTFCYLFEMAQGISIDDEAKAPTPEPFVAAKYSSGEVFSSLFSPTFFLTFRLNHVIFLIKDAKAKAHLQSLG